jgi:hypothetical protein
VDSHTHSWISNYRHRSIGVELNPITPFNAITSTGVRTRLNLPDGSIRFAVILIFFLIFLVFGIVNPEEKRIIIS